MTRILLTGGTGSLGTEVLPLLQQDGHELRIMSRSPRRAGYEAGIEWVQAEIDTGRGLSAAVADIDVIVHLASNAQKAQKVDIEGTGRLVEEAKKAGVAHIVYVSIPGIEHIPFTYFQAKLKAEGIVERGGVPWTILRAAQFHSLMPRLFLLPARTVPLIAPVPKAFRFQPIDESEVAVRVAELAGGQPAGRVPDIGGPETLSLETIARAYLDAAGMRKPIVNLPLFGKIAAGFRGDHHIRAMPYGRITWEQWLARKFGAENKTHPQTMGSERA